MKVGVIGCGTIANAQHIPAYIKNSNAEIKYFCDIIPERAEEAVAKYGIGKAVMLADANPVRVMAMGGEKHPSFVVEFDNGKAAHLIHRNDDLYTYAVTPVDKNNNCVRRVIESRFFAEFIKAVISFFKTGEIPVSRERIMRTVSVVQSAEVSLEKPFEWVNID